MVVPPDRCLAAAYRHDLTAKPRASLNLVLGAANHDEFLHGAKFSVHPFRAVNQSTSLFLHPRRVN